MEENNKEKRLDKTLEVVKNVLEENNKKNTEEYEEIIKIIEKRNKEGKNNGDNA